MATSDSEENAGRVYHQRTVEATDDLVSVTVRKSDPNQKAGISLVERQEAVYVTKVTENGLFHGTEIEMGDLVLSINGNRLKKGEGARDIIMHIADAKATVTMVVKKANKKARRGARSLSPLAQRRRRNPKKMFTKAAHRNTDGR
jgi:C-terminal processing protease CtpA/Prc